MLEFILAILLIFTFIILHIKSNVFFNYIRIKSNVFFNYIRIKIKVIGLDIEIKSKEKSTPSSQDKC